MTLFARSDAENEEVDLLSSLHVKTVLISLPGDEFIKHVFARILGREPEFDTKDLGKTLENSESDKINYLFSVFLSPESVEKFSGDYISQTKCLVLALGYSVAAGELAANLRKVYPILSVLQERSVDLAAAITSNTRAASLRFDQSPYGESQAALTTKIYSLTEAVDRLTTAQTQLSADIRDLRWQFADSRGNGKGDDIVKSHSDNEEMLAMLSAVLAQVKERL